VPPLMMSVTVSLLITQRITRKSFDEAQILTKGIPFLPAELPELLEDESAPIQALDLCTRPYGLELPGAARLPPEAPVRVVEEALDCEVNGEQVDDFPVIVDGDRCIGFATRARLEAAMASHLQDAEVVPSVTAQRFSVTSPSGMPVAVATRSWFLDTGTPSVWATPLHVGTGDSSASPPERGRPSLDVTPLPVGRRLTSESTSECLVQVAQLAESPPHTVLHNMPGSRMYSLFAKAGVRVASVVADDGSFCGMVTRKGLIATLRRPPPDDDLAQGPRRAVSSEDLSGLGSSDDSDGAETVSLLQVARVGDRGL